MNPETNKLEAKMQSVQDNLETFSKREQWRRIFHLMIDIKKFPRSLKFERFIKNPRKWCKVYGLTLENL